MAGLFGRPEKYRVTDFRVTRGTKFEGAVSPRLRAPRDLDDEGVVRVEWTLTPADGAARSLSLALGATHGNTVGEYYDYLFPALSFEKEAVGDPKSATVRDLLHFLHPHGEGYCGWNSPTK